MTNGSGILPPGASPSGEKIYLVAADLKWRDDKLGECHFCQWIFRCDQDIEPGSDESRADHSMIWVTGHGDKSNITGMPTEFDVYVQDLKRNSGHKGRWKACWDHAYLAYMDTQQIMLDELHDWDLTDRWMQNRNGRI